MSKNTISDPELILTRMIDAPPEKGFQAWTETKLLEQWFTPKPWTTSIVKSDLRPGGSSWIVMRNPEVEEFPNPGFYLEVIKIKKRFLPMLTRAHGFLLKNPFPQVS